MGRSLVNPGSLVVAVVLFFDSAYQDVTAAEQLAQCVPQQNTSLKSAKSIHALFRHTSYPVAWTAAQKSNRPMLLYVTMPSCHYCVKMIKNTYENPAVGELVSESFETVYIDRYAQEELIAKLRIKIYPTTILVSTKNQVLDVIEGYVESQTFRRRLKTDLATMHSSTQKRVATTAIR